MSGSLSNLGELTAKGLRELSEHPLKYSASAIRSAIRDYGDLAIAMFGGYLMSNASERFNFFGDYDWVNGLQIAAVGTALGAAAGREEAGPRVARNLYGAAGANFIGKENIPGYTFGAVSLALSLVMENMRRKEIKRKEAGKSSIDPLESLV